VGSLIEELQAARDHDLKLVGRDPSEICPNTGCAHPRSDHPEYAGCEKCECLWGSSGWHDTGARGAAGGAWSTAITVASDYIASHPDFDVVVDSAPYGDTIIAAVEACTWMTPEQRSWLLEDLANRFERLTGTVVAAERLTLVLSPTERDMLKAIAEEGVAEWADTTAQSLLEKIEALS
jgi:hypothetical protein